ncbi:serine/threonine protein phosphatase PP2A-associated protein [Panaeolus papilionaceus]|nr:serine/threonine protein phosphatase PP2A-associated protein [Panaeolus papilionaceus]
MSDESLTLSALYECVLKTASKINNLPTIEDHTQDLVAECLRNLQDLFMRVVNLGIFSPNETLEDVSTRDLIYLSAPYVYSEVQGRVKTIDRLSRLQSLVEAQKYVNTFIDLLHRYQVIPGEEMALYDKKTATVADFAKRRELKINQFKKEKELRARIEKIRKDRGQKAADDDETPNDFDLIASLLNTETTKDEDDDPFSEAEEALREAILIILRLNYAHACTQQQSMEQEITLLRNAPPEPEHSPPKEDAREKKKQAERDDWRLDIPVAGGPDGKGPLMDSAGRPLRPFTILPSDAGERARLQAEVFGPDYRLPTMSVDEYLEIERQRGNIITGGGPASEAAPTSKEQLAMDAEMDGTVQGELKAEEKRQKDENWAQFTDANPRGAGNTMNRG